MRLADDDRRELERRYRTPQEIEHGIITCEVPAATCVDRKQLLGVIYWQGCAAFPRDLARRRAGAQGHPKIAETTATRLEERRHAGETPEEHAAQVGTAWPVPPWRWRSQMTRGIVTLSLAALAALAPAGPVWACGGEVPISCDAGDGEDAARWMLRRVMAAVEADKAQALGQFARGEGGFRTLDTYVFCIGPDAVMTAHRSEALRARDLQDEAGHPFVATMLGTAAPGQVLRTHYQFPGSTGAVPRTTFYTRAGDQVCGVGLYDAEEQPAPAAEPRTRAAQVRLGLGG